LERPHNSSYGLATGANQGFGASQTAGRIDGEGAVHANEYDFVSVAGP
jgi:hypothetical protein